MTPGTLLYYHGAGPAWRGGWRLCVLVKIIAKHKSNRNARSVRLIDVGSLDVYRVMSREIDRFARGNSSVPTAKYCPRCAIRKAHVVDTMLRRQAGWLGTLTEDQERRANEVLDVLA